MIDIKQALMIANSNTQHAFHMSTNLRLRSGQSLSMVCCKVSIWFLAELCGVDAANGPCLKWSTIQSQQLLMGIHLLSLLSSLRKAVPTFLKQTNRPKTQQTTAVLQYCEGFLQPIMKLHQLLLAVEFCAKPAFFLGVRFCTLHYSYYHYCCDEPGSAEQQKHQVHTAEQSVNFSSWKVMQERDREGFK